MSVQLFEGRQRLLIVLVAFLTVGASVTAWISMSSGNSPSSASAESSSNLPKEYNVTEADFAAGAGSESPDQIAARVASEIGLELSTIGVEGSQAESLRSHLRDEIETTLVPTPESIESYASRHGLDYDSEFFEQSNPVIIERRSKVLEGSRIGTPWVRELGPLESAYQRSTDGRNGPSAIFGWGVETINPINYRAAWQRHVSQPVTEVMIPVEYRVGESSNITLHGTIGIWYVRSHDAPTGWAVVSKQLYFDESGLNKKIPLPVF